LDRIDGCDDFLAVAAVSDFRVVNSSSQKIKKVDGVPELVLAENPDILRDVVAAASGAFVVGFAAETDGENFA
jgi:phosphopantothenoylcysteine decarboxylase/phosphopantothenate--cysteine ligase